MERQHNQRRTGSSAITYSAAVTVGLVVARYYEVRTATG